MNKIIPRTIIPKKKGYDEAIVRRFNMRLDLIFAYNGLGNQGATCYLNSVLQVFFMTKDFREAVESHCCQDKKSVDFQLKRLFKTLKTSETHPKDILCMLSISNVYDQRDAAEYFEMILNKVHPDLSKIFKGHLRHTTRCLKRHVAIDETGPFWTLPLSMKDLSESNKPCSVSKGFKDFFQPSTVCGIYCDQCEGKTDATITCELVKPPEILTLLLKRFEFDYHSMSYVKTESCVDVPHTLHVKDCTYELYAVVDHVGSLRGGHYTATIQSYEDHNWYRFDDTYVRMVDPQSIRHMDNRRSQSVYLLMYKKSCTPNQPRVDIKKKEELKLLDEDWKIIDEKLGIMQEELKRTKEVLKKMLNVLSKTWEYLRRSGNSSSPRELMRRENIKKEFEETLREIIKYIREIKKSMRENEMYKTRFNEHRKQIEKDGREREKYRERVGQCEQKDGEAAEIYRKEMKKNRRGMKECRRGIEKYTQTLVKYRKITEHMAESVTSY